MLCYIQSKRWRIGNSADVEMLEETYTKLKEIIKKTDITWKWIVIETGISKRTIYRWMGGEHKPHPVLFLKLKEVVDRLYDLSFKKIVLE